MTDVAPDRIGELVAFRCWWVYWSRLRGPRLLSVTTATWWPTDRWMVAKCKEQPDVEGIPHLNCHCGIYAAVSRASLVENFGYAHHQPWGEGYGVAVGEVGMAGRIVPGELAHRAERARPLHLWVPYDQWRLASPLESAYKIPVSLTNVLSERGFEEDADWQTR